MLWALSGTDHLRWFTSSYSCNNFNEVNDYGHILREENFLLKTCESLIKFSQMERNS